MRVLPTVTIMLLTAAVTSAAVSPVVGRPAPPDVLVPAIDAVRRGACADVLGVLRQAARVSTPTGARAAYVLGHCLAVLRRYEESRAAFLEAARRHETLAARSRLGAARAALAAGDARGAVDLSRPSAGASAAAAAQLLLLQAEALLRIGRARESARAARAVLQGRHPDGVLAAAWWLLGRASAEAGDLDTARSAYAMAWWGIPDTPRSPDAALRLRGLSAGRDPVPTAQARAERGLRLVGTSEFGAAERELALAVQGVLPRPLAAEAWYQLGLLRLGTPAAASAFQQAARLPVQRDRALFWLGLARVRVGDGAQARAAWERLRREFPDSLWSARAVATLGRLAEGAARWEEADRLYALLIDRYPDSPRTDDARWRRAWLRYRHGRREEARALFIRYGAAFPEAPRASAHLYWASRISSERDRAAGAALLRETAKRYPLTFYGQRARLRLGLPQPARASTPRRALAPTSFEGTAEELAALGFDAEALEEMESVSPDPVPTALRRLAAELYARAGDATKSIGAVEPLVDAALYGRRQLDDGLWRLAYPRAYWPQVFTSSTSHGLDPLLVLAVIREESRFDPRVVSGAGAVGLMQLLPSTARGVLGGPVDPARLKSSGVNIAAGTAYLARLIQRFQGSVPLALGAYNAGPGGVRRQADLARTDLDRYVEELPYAETREYVQRVLQSYGIYRWLYGR